jgi:hypothetical protein
VTAQRTRAFVAAAAVIVVAITVAVMVFRGRAQHPASHGKNRQIKRSEMSAAELKFGIAPVPDRSVVYQPNVIVVGGGAEAIRSMSSNGLTWTIDASAPRADELAEGKIMFMTDLAAGRVLGVQKDGNDLAVTLGPVNITDLIRTCDINPGPIPIDFNDAIPFTVPDLPGRLIPTKRSAGLRPRDDTGRVLPAAYWIDQDAPPASVPPAKDVSSLNFQFKLEPYVSNKGFGVRGTTDRNGMKVAIEAAVFVDNPTLVPILHLDDTTLVGGSVKLTGAAGLRVKFDTGTDVGLKANLHGWVQGVPDFVLHLATVPPIAVTVRQMLTLDTSLGVRNTTLSATGEYSFGGSFMVDYSNNKWTVGGPIGFNQKQSILGSSTGASLGASGINLTHEMKIIAGIGAGGFAAGPYFALITAVGLFKGPDISAIECRQSTIVITMTGGIGYLIPKPIADAINFILGALHVHYKVNTFEGIQAKPLPILDSSSTLPGCGPEKKN